MQFKYKNFSKLTKFRFFLEKKQFFSEKLKKIEFFKTVKRGKFAVECVSNDIIP